jgi:hypothetical protein
MEKNAIMTHFRRFAILSASVLALAVANASPPAVQATASPAGPRLPDRVIDLFSATADWAECSDVTGRFTGAIQLSRPALVFESATIPSKLGAYERGGGWAHRLPVTADWPDCSNGNGNLVTEDWPDVKDVNGNLRGAIQMA